MLTLALSATGIPTPLVTFLTAPHTQRNSSESGKVPNHADKKKSTKQNEYSIICTIFDEWILKKLVRSEKNLKRQRKWARPQPPSSNRLKLEASWR
jgi:hypothetical protein